MGTRKRIQYLFNPLVLPSSILVKLVNIYMFRCNNKLLFLTSGFGDRTPLPFVFKKKRSKSKESGEIFGARTQEEGLIRIILTWFLSFSFFKKRIPSRVLLLPVSNRTC
ncbi:hypothetical protein AHAS_Ahas07G0026900 [Arachis hypogaea]